MIQFMLLTYIASYNSPPYCWAVEKESAWIWNNTILYWLSFSFNRSFIANPPKNAADILTGEQKTGTADVEFLTFDFPLFPFKLFFIISLRFCWESAFFYIFATVLFCLGVIFYNNFVFYDNFFFRNSLKTWVSTEKICPVKLIWKNNTDYTLVSELGISSCLALNHKHEGVFGEVPLSLISIWLCVWFLVFSHSQHSVKCLICSIAMEVVPLMLMNWMKLFDQLKLMSPKKKSMKSSAVWIRTVEKNFSSYKSFIFDEEYTTIRAAEHFFLSVNVSLLSLKL